MTNITFIEESFIRKSNCLQCLLWIVYFHWKSVQNSSQYFVFDLVDSFLGPHEKPTLVQLSYFQYSPFLCVFPLCALSTGNLSQLFVHISYKPPLFCKISLVSAHVCISIFQHQTRIFIFRKHLHFFLEGVFSSILAICGSVNHTFANWWFLVPQKALFLYLFLSIQKIFLMICHMHVCRSGQVKVEGFRSLCIF